MVIDPIFAQRPKGSSSPASSVLLAVAIGLASLLGCSVSGRDDAAGSGASNGPLARNDGATLRARVTPPDDAVVEMYSGAGANHAQAHNLTDEEWTLVEAALSDLPPLHRDTLVRYLGRISFVDAPGSAGTALTRDIDGSGPERLYEITLRADVLKKSLTEFLNTKEAQIYEADGSGYEVQIIASDMPAVTYLLLHEATHVVDGVFGITTEREGALFAGVWKDYRGLASPYDESIIANLAFRGGPKISRAEAPSLYAALARSPFVTPYATASAGEDFAELFAWRELALRFNVNLRIEVRNREGQLVFRGEPLTSPAIQQRFQGLDAYASKCANGCGSVTWKPS